MKDRKPACIFFFSEFIDTSTYNKCILRKEKIEEETHVTKFDMYRERDQEWAREFTELPGCPFIRDSGENRATEQQIKAKCDKCSKRVRWTKQHQREAEAARLENRGF